MNYREIMESEYDREAWQRLLHDIFRNRAEFRRAPVPAQANGDLAKEALYLGKIGLTDGETIAVYEVELDGRVDMARNRRGIRDMLTPDWRNRGCAGAFVLSFRRGGGAFRFSYVSETWGFNRQGEYRKISTDTLRHTYLLGVGRGCRTAADRFTSLKHGGQTLCDVTEAFSVEALTRLFYRDLFEWYRWAVDPSTGVTFPNNPAVEEDDREDMETKIIRMITRIMFVWFIKQKGLVPDRIFDEVSLGGILRDFDPQSATSGSYLQRHPAEPLLRHPQSCR